MPEPLLVIITGPPCTGKTSLGWRLAKETGLPFFYKDGFKEMMYDVIIERHGVDGITPDISKLLGMMSIRSLTIVIEQLVLNGQSLIAEANFDSQRFTPVIKQLQERVRFRVLQVQLRCDGDVLMERFIHRELTERHPGHQGLANLDSLMPVLSRGEQDPLDLPCDLFVYDTTEISTLDYEPVIARVRQYVATD